MYFYVSENIFIPFLFYIYWW